MWGAKLVHSSHSEGGDERVDWQRKSPSTSPDWEHPGLGNGCGAFPCYFTPFPWTRRGLGLQKHGDQVLRTAFPVFRLFKHMGTTSPSPDPGPSLANPNVFLAVPSSKTNWGVAAVLLSGPVQEGKKALGQSPSPFLKTDIPWPKEEAGSIALLLPSSPGPDQ